MKLKVFNADTWKIKDLLEYARANASYEQINEDVVITFFNDKDLEKMYKELPCFGYTVKKI